MKSLRIGFVSSHPSMRRFHRDASFIYRCENLGLALRRQGHSVEFFHLNALLIPRTLDVAVFLRPFDSLRFRHIVRNLNSRGTLIVCDFDDLIFDTDAAQFRPSVLKGTEDLNKTRAKFAKHSDALALADIFTTTTVALIDRFKTSFPDKRSALIPNAIHANWYQIPLREEGGQKVISYFSGTKTHDRDFALIAPLLKKLLDRDELLRLRIVGPVSVPFKHERLELIDKVAFADYPFLVRDNWLNLSPLENTPFNQAKSALKIIEPGFFGVPTIASPVGDLCRFKIEGVLFAESEDEWEAQITLALQPDVYAQLTTGLRQRILAEADIDRYASNFLALIQR